MKIGNKARLWEDTTLNFFICIHKQVDVFISEQCRTPFVGSYEEEPTLPVEVDKVILSMLGYVIEDEDR